MPVQYSFVLFPFSTQIEIRKETIAFSKLRLPEVNFAMDGSFRSEVEFVYSNGHAGAQCPLCPIK